MFFPTRIAKWPDLEAQVKSWKTDHGHHGFFCVYKEDYFRIKKWTCWGSFLILQIYDEAQITHATQISIWQKSSIIC